MPGVVQPVPAIKHTIASASSLLDKEWTPVCDELWMPRLRVWVGVQDPSELRDCLELADYPPVRGGGHQHDIVHNRMLIVDGLAAVMDFKVVLGSVVQFDHVTYGGIENGLEFMPLVDVSRNHTASLLAAYSFSQPVIRRAGKKAVQGAS